MSYRSTVARQPEALTATLVSVTADLAAQDLSKLGQGLLAITGIGASFAAAVVGVGELHRHGRRALAIRACDLYDGHDLADSLIGLSHRGRSVETVTAFERLPSAIRLAITKDPESPLAEVADLHLKLDNGGDATPSSTGYTASLLALGMVLETVTGGDTDWAALPELVEAQLAAAAKKMPKLAAAWTDRRAIDCVGAGASLGTADGASLLIREAARIPASAYDTRHYLHGPMESMDAGTAVMIFGSDREIALARNLAEIGCPTLLVTTSEEIDDSENLTVVRVPKLDNRVAQGIVDIVAAQLLAATLSDAAGLTDVKFRYRQSDTKIGQPVAA